MNDPSASRLNFWRQQAQHLRSGVNQAAPFAAGILSALVALLLYNALFPAAKPLTARDVKNSVIQVMASATPAPTFSSRVYQIIQPSLVLIETKASHENSKDDFGLGTGVVIDDKGNILTSLHVVEVPTEIKVTFADDSQSRATIINTISEKDIAVLSADELQKVYQNLPMSIIAKHETMEISVVFTAIGVLLALLAILLSFAWHPLP